MKTDYSRTAEGMALIRAMEQWVPRSRRIIDDPFALMFLRHWYFRAIARSRILARLMLAFVDRWAPGGQELLTIRARLSDDEAIEFAKAGGQQIVLLGAGFDTLALRLQDRLSAVKVFEVDHPATQNIKREVLATLGELQNLFLIPVDFEEDDFVARLQEAGFDPLLRSLVIWVGVTYYLTPLTAERAFREIASLVGKGSRMIFDFLLADVVDGTSTNSDALTKARRVAQLGEPWLFGVKPSDLDEFLLQFGFVLTNVYDAEELRARYAPRRNKPIDYVRIAVCERN